MEKRQQSLFESSPPQWELDEADDRLVVQVVFAEAPYGPFDYRVPELLRPEVKVGCRMMVPLGRSNRRVVGYCTRLIAPGTETPSRRLKDVVSLLDEHPLLSPSMLELTKWMADYYICPWGQVLDGVVPAGVRGQAGTRQVTLLSVPTSVAAQMTQLKLPAKQSAALQYLLENPEPLTIGQLGAAAGCTAAPIRALQKKGLLQAEVVRVQQKEHHLPAIAPDTPPQLNRHQQLAVESMLNALNAGRPQVVLVHGVTGSGKTEVYMQAIKEVISFGRQAIVLVPEISLTPQTVSRFRSRFDSVAVLHSHLSPAERHWHWDRIASGEVSVIVGARSAVFAPTPHLGLIVLDEEHDASFKQDSVPRYHTRDVAIERAKQERIPVVLGSATPSLESWHRAQAGEFELVALPDRVMDRPLPHVSVIDLRAEQRNRGSRGAISRPMYLAMKDSLQEGGQTILLLNRRGYSTYIQCPACGEVVKCPECDIALTHHRDGAKAICHYCDYATTPPVKCPECNFEGIRYSGLGTQRLEAEINARFPDYSCVRMDTDTMRRHGSHEEVLDRFRAGEVQILLGTQMIAKGLDFPNVTLVGVVNADTALHFPDFRSGERTFQLVTQVAGRAGRGPKGGRVVVQTLSPDHIAIQTAVQHDYISFANQELADRVAHHYPPAAKMIRIILRGPQEAIVEAAGEEISQRLRSAMQTPHESIRILGPAPAPIAKLRGKFRFHLLLIGEHGDPMRELVSQVCARLSFSSDVQFAIDVDPSDML